MKHPLCPFCQKPKATLECGLCHSAVCKYCAQFVDEGRLSFLPKLPKELSHTTYCGPCYDVKISPQIEAYDLTMEKAKNINIFYKNESKETRLVERNEKPLKVENCPDKEETILRLAFLAALANFNSIIDVDLVSTKVRHEAYQTSIWRGQCLPAQLSDAKINAKRFN